jgi:acyl-CoA thioester hydrolase
MGLVYYANYLKYFERARSEWADASGYGMDWQQEQQVYFPVRNVEIEYLKPARLHELVDVTSRIIDIGKVTFTYEQDLRPADQKGTLLCKAHTKVVCVDYNFKPKMIPDFLKNQLS